jgi:hypothetical protein
MRLFQNATTLHEAERHAAQSELIRTELVTLLASAAAANAIGVERARSMADLARQMGVLALGGAKAKVHKEHGAAASNGVYLALHSSAMAGAKVRIPYESSRQNWTLPPIRPGRVDGAAHSIKDDEPGLHLITMPASDDTISRTVMAAHELTHVRQTKDRSSWGIPRNTYDQAAAEAEAYEVQFRLHDTILGGALREVAQASIDHGAIFDKPNILVIPEGLVLPDGREKLTDVEAASVINGAYNMHYGYDVSLPNDVPQGIVDMYIRDDKLARQL